MPHEFEPSRLPRLPADMREPKELERLRLAEPTRCAIPGGVPPELDQPRLLGVQLQTEFREPVAKVSPELLCVFPMLKSHHEVSRREGSHLPALAEPGVNLSAHRAPIVQPSGRRPQRQWANRSGWRLATSA